MSSVIPGYEYDIFISYRQKDNKLDGWVTEFVSNLRSEIEATFKEDISIYFDENPHDGLLETHDVDQSLEQKVKCLVFVAIVSHTYCDPNSFAWQKEFITFRDFAKRDEFGLDIKVANGNVAKRVLPVRIHEIDQQDKLLFEKEVGGVMRPVDFIFKSAGVNRPLTPGDPRTENDNGTLYRDQINKVANGIKEIIGGLKNSTPGAVRPSPSNQRENVPQKSRKGRRLPWIFGILILLAAAVYWFLPRDSSHSKEREISIAVLPFDNLSTDQEQEYFSDGLTEDIIDRLSRIRDLRVISRTSSMSYKDSNKTISEIADELGVNYILEGSVRKNNSTIRVVAQLIDTETDNHIWSTTLDKPEGDVFKLQAEIATNLARYFEISLSEDEEGSVIRVPTESIEAYDLVKKSYKFQYSRRPEDNEIAVKNIQKALALDPDYYDALGMLSFLYSDRYRRHRMGEIWQDSSIYYAQKLIELYPERPEGYRALGFVRNDENSFSNYLKANRLDPSVANTQLGTHYMWRNPQLDSAMAYFRRGLLYSPTNSFLLMRVGQVWELLEQYDSASNYYERSMTINSSTPDIIDSRSQLYLLTRQVDEGIKFAKSRVQEENLDSPVRQRLEVDLAEMYAIRGNLDSAHLILATNSRFNQSFLMTLLKKEMANKDEFDELLALKRSQIEDINSPVANVKLKILEDHLDEAVELLEGVNHPSFYRDLKSSYFFDKISNHPKMEEVLAAHEQRLQEYFQTIKAGKIVFE